MNDLELIRKLRSDPPPAEPAAMLRARAALQREMRGETRGPGSVRAGRWRLGWQLAAAGGLAAVLGIALVAAAPNDTAHPNNGAQANAVTDAAGILRQAALAAEHEPILPARPDQYVFVESIDDYHGETFDCDGKADQSHCAAIPDPATPTLRQIWLSVDGAHDGFLRTRPHHGGAWNDTPMQACPTGPRPPKGVRVTKQQAGNCTPTPAYLAGLPTNVAAMTTYLGAKAAESANGDLFTAAGELVGEAYLPPASQAAVFRALGDVADVTVAQDAVDAAGRHGVSVGRDAHGFRNELIFDRTTFDFLGSRTIALQDVGKLTKGTVAGQSARLRLAIVDGLRQLP